jgi:hypothetical protein
VMVRGGAIPSCLSISTDMSKAISPNGSAIEGMRKMSSLHYCCESGQVPKA